MKIEFLYFEGCSSYKLALDLLQEILKEAGVEPAIEMIRIKSDAMAEAFKFPGSPTIRINGQDVDETHEISGYSQKCRVYEENGILTGVPPEGLIRNAIRENLIG